MTHEHKTRAIVNGPGAFDLMWSLFKNQKVEFTLFGNDRIRVRVTGMDIYGDFSNGWLIRFTGEKTKFRGYYNTLTRRGWCKIVA